jgi:hypothetical protein
MNRMTDRYDTHYDEEECGTNEEAEVPTDRPEPYPKDLPVKLKALRDWALRSGEYDHSSYIRWTDDGRMLFDFAGRIAVESGRYQPVWEFGSQKATEVRPAPSPGIARSSMVIPVPDAAQSVLGLTDRESEVLFYGEDVAGNENEQLSLAFLDHLITRSSGEIPGFHMSDDDVTDFVNRWSGEQGITDPDNVWEPGQVSPKAFVAA